MRLKLNVEKAAGGSDDYYRKSWQSNEKVAQDNIKNQLSPSRFNSTLKNFNLLSFIYFKSCLNLWINLL